MLEEWLLNMYDIKPTDKLRIPGTNNYTMQDIIDSCKKSGTEKSVVSNMKAWGYDSKDDQKAVLIYLSGLTKRLIYDRVIS